MKTLVLYLPVFHRGYQLVIEEVRPDRLVLLNKEQFIDVFPELRKDIRALPVELAVQVLGAVFPDMEISIFSTDAADEIRHDELVMTIDEVSRYVANAFFSDAKVTFHSAFLRWDKERILQPQAVIADKISEPSSADNLLSKLADQTNLSSDWWRQVAAALVKQGELVAVAHNTHTPSDQETYYQGDARSFFHKGEYVEISTSLHAEAAVIGAAARRGISVEGAEMYVTTFPCPYCARLIAHSGIAKLFYKEGYSMLDGQELLKSAGVEIIQLNE